MPAEPLPPYPKRLIEVDLPIKRISAHARREKSIRHGHISTLHIWWARRPLAACRAVILAALWPDPADPLCPERFRKEAADRMRELRDKRGGKPRNWDDPLEVRAALLDFIADFANWDNSNEEDYLTTSRALVQVAHEALEQVTLKEYLEHVWAAVAKEALNMIFAGADATGFEEDARLTAMWLWTLSAKANTEAANGGHGDDADDEDEAPAKKAKMVGGFTLEYDAARKIAQGLGAHLETLTSLVEVKGSEARLLPVAERTRALFGKDDASAPATKSRKKKQKQLSMGFAADLEEAEESGGWGEKGVPARAATVLSRIHQSMILFAAGRGDALKRFLVDEGVGSDERFWRLAQALSALYPSSTDEKRWVDGVLARKKALGL